MSKLAEAPLEIVEESLVVDTRTVHTGTVRVSTRTDLIEELAHADLERTDYEVTRVAIGSRVDAVPPVRTEGDVTIIPVIEEILVVEKRLVLKEEIHLRRIASSETVEVPVTLRKQHAVIERVPPTPTITEEDIAP